jgi:hypothetical protein
MEEYPMSHFRLSAAPAAVALVSVLAGILPGRVAVGVPPNPYSIDFFPDTVQTNWSVMLGFFGPCDTPNGGVGYQIDSTRLVIGFTTAAGFQAEDLFVQLVAPAGKTFIFVSGASLGWSGQGTFEADLEFEDLNGEIGEGLWTFDVWAAGSGGYSGAFTSDTRWDIELSPVGAGCDEDLDGDGVIGVGDLIEVILAWGRCGGGECPADIDGDQSVDVVDLVAVISAWGDC